MTRLDNVLCLLLAGFWFAGPTSPAAAAQQQKIAPKDGLEENFQAEHEIGRRFHFDPLTCRRRRPAPIVTDRSLIVPYNGQTLQVPPGFTATPFATGLVNPRRLLVLPNGDVLVAEQSAGYLTLLRDDGEGHAKWIDRHVEDLNRPYGLAWQGDEILVADQDGDLARAARRRRVARRPAGAAAEGRRPGAAGPAQAGAGRLRRGDADQEGRVRHRAGPPEPASGDRPEDRRPVSSASARRAISASSPSPKRRSSASMPTARTRRPSPRARATRPRSPSSRETGDLWAVVQERDGLGDNLPSDYLIRVQQGGFYGWPYAYIGKHPQPGLRAARARQGRRRRSRPICCSRRIPRCSTSCSTRATSSRPNTRAACSSR